MNSVLPAVTFASMDAGAESTGMYLRRVTAGNIEFIPRMTDLCVTDFNYLGPHTVYNINGTSQTFISDALCDPEAFTL